MVAGFAIVRGALGVVILLAAPEGDHRGEGSRLDYCIRERKGSTLVFSGIVSELIEAPQLRNGMGAVDANVGGEVFEGKQGSPTPE